jgi:hypothetical protein
MNTYPPLWTAVRMVVLAVSVAPERTFGSAEEPVP